MINTKYINNILTFFILSNGMADLASPIPFTVTQPNGIKININNRGNHLQGWHEYHEWTIVKNPQNWWVYASGNDGFNLLPSDLKVGIDPEPNLLSSTIQKGIRPDKRILEDHAPIPNLQATRTDTFHVPLILVEFPDAAATYDSTDFELIMNQPGYTHLNYNNTGSFRDFYQEISYGQFLPISEVTNWITAPNSHDYYAYNNPNGWSHVRQLVRAMVDSLEAQGFDWSLYDNDNDGYVDALNLLHQGEGAEQGDHSNIWSHKSSLGNLSVNYDGVTISSYTMNPEIQSGTIVAIGVLAHEFGHALGLPDLYDTDYSSTGAGKLALMASGSWGTSGNSPWYPATMIGWCKNRLGWVNVVEITDDTNLISLQQSYSNNTIIRVNHSQVSEEHWLIENRQKIGSDTLMPTPGLAIWHINDNIAQGWGPNTNEPYYGVGLEQADGQFALENGGPSDGGDVFPGNSDNREFSHSSTPNTTSLYDVVSMLRIDNISDPDEFMSFDVEYGEIILATAFIYNGSGYANNEGNFSIGLSNEMVINELEFQLHFSPNVPEIIAVEPTERTSFDSAIFTNNTVTLVNPIIEAGTGAILDLTLFNNTGVETDVNVSFEYCLAFNYENVEVGVTASDQATYHINPLDQYFNIQDGTGTAGGGASYVVSLYSTVPIPMAVFQLSHSPDLLSPSDEPFEDLNDNETYDMGEPFTDWNQNSEWTPMIESIDLTESWEFDITLSGSDIIVGLSNWQMPLEPGSHNLFRVNCAVSTDAQLNEEITVNTNVMILLDAWGHDGVPFVNGTGMVTIDNVLSLGEAIQFPTEFSLNQIYPNPFNPVTTIQYDIATTENTSLRIFDLTGRLIETLIYENLEPGHYQIKWQPTNIPSGLYFIELISGTKRDIQKITILK
jgi:M6 family metalloprotease-like protein